MRQLPIENHDLDFESRTALLLNDPSMTSEIEKSCFLVATMLDFLSFNIC